MSGTGILDNSKLVNADIGFRTVFAEAFKTAPSYWRELAMEVPSTNASEDYHWVSDVPGMKPWRGEVELHELRAFAQNVPNVKYSTGLRIQREDIEDDNLGIIRPKIARMAQRAALHYDALLFALMNAGASGDCYDGKKFFATNHSEGSSGTQSNYSTLALDADNLATQIAMMMGIKDSTGEPMDINPTHLVVGPSNRKAALAILAAEYLPSGGGSNINFESLKLVISPRVTGEYWFLLDLRSAMRPFVLQIRRPIEFTALENPNDPLAFEREEFLYKCVGRHAAAYGLWQFANGNFHT